MGIKRKVRTFAVQHFADGVVRWCCAGARRRCAEPSAAKPDQQNGAAASGPADQVAQTKGQAQAGQNVPPGLYDAAPLVTKSGPSWLPAGVQVSMAGTFVAFEGSWKQRDELASGATNVPFSTGPFPNSPLYHQGNTNFTAQQSRIAFKASGDIDPSQKLTSYFEMDFLGAATTSNARESNSFTPRIRQGWMEYDNSDWHFHVSAGQQWSLATQDRVGMLPLSENVPLTIDAQYVVGFNWDRNPSIRFVEDINKMAWFGVSIESPQVVYSSNSVGILGAGSQSAAGTITSPVPAPAAGKTTASVATNTPSGVTNIGGGSLPTGVGIAGVNTINVCNSSGLLNSTTGCSNDLFPDLVEKFAFDPGWGHYEVFGLQRFFTDEVLLTNGTSQNKTAVGWGLGGSVLLPVLPKFLDVQGNALGGQGIGRYGASQLPDVTIGPNGQLTPLAGVNVMLGLVAHPWQGLDLYAYAGQEQVNANYWKTGATAGGYGNPLAVNNGCQTLNTGSGPAGYNDPIAGSTCTANVQKTQEITGGFWQNLYNGEMGRVRFGVQYAYMRLTAFQGVPGAPTPSAAGLLTPNQGLSPNNQAVYFSLRYYPFN